jgi:hypothetical protein
LVDQLRAAIGADSSQNCEDDESDEKNAARTSGEFRTHGETEQAKAGGEAGGDEHKRFVNRENSLDGASREHGGFGEPSRECGEAGGESAEIQKSDGSAMPVVIGAPNGEGREKESGEPESDWKMNEERMDVEHGFQAGEHAGLLRKLVGRFWRRCVGDAKAEEH